MNLKILIFSDIFLNSDILKFGIHVQKGHLEGRVSQIFYLGPNFHVMEFRKYCFKKCKKVTLFFGKE